MRGTFINIPKAFLTFIALQRASFSIVEHLSSFELSPPLSQAPFSQAPNSEALFSQAPSSEAPFSEAPFSQALFWSG
jgi:hypothetical protein